MAAVRASHARESRSRPGLGDRMMPISGDVAWHAQPEQQLLELLRTSRTGLSREEAERRLADHGPNALPEARAHLPILRFLRQFHSALIYFLLAGAGAAMMLGHGIDAAVILVVVLVNAVVGFVQEGKRSEERRVGKECVRPGRT